MNIHNSTKQVIPQQVQPVQYSELLFRLLPRLSVVVAAVKAVWVVDVGVGVGAPVATATDDDDNRGCGGCCGFPVE